MVEVRPEGGDSGVNALENRVLCLKEAFIECVLPRSRSGEAGGGFVQRFPKEV